LKSILALVLAGSLTACSPVAREARYTGTMTPESACGATEHATLVVATGTASFAANDGAVVVPATVAPDGKLAGQLVLTGGDKKPFPLTLEGTVTQDTATGSYTTPRCRFALSLKRVHPGLFGSTEP
jgi:hypothetical protein